MLVRFIMENYKSFDSECDLNMLAGSSGKHPKHVMGKNDCGVIEPLLKSAVIYGANGSGKSNLIKGITFAKKFIAEGLKPKQRIPVERFLLKEEVEPTRFEFYIDYKDILYNYGFVLDHEKVYEEWLFVKEDKPSAKEAKYFERLTDQSGEAKVEPASKLARKGSEAYKFLGYVAQGLQQNKLFLTEAYEKKVEKLLPLMGWFENVLLFIHPSSNFSPLVLGVHQNQQFAKFLGEYLNKNDTGINSLAIENSDLDFDVHFPQMSEKEKQVIYDTVLDDSFLPISKLNGLQKLVTRENGKLKILELKAVHIDKKGREVKFDFEKESDGTNRLVNLLPLLFSAGFNEKVYVIDEFERSLHPMLTRSLLETFLNGLDCKRGQLIFTTHETHLLNLELLRQDEIWFTEKDEFGGSHLFSLVNLNIRSDARADKQYLDGRYGAIPFIGKVSDLVEDNNGCANE